MSSARKSGQAGGPKLAKVLNRWLQRAYGSRSLAAKAADVPAGTLGSALERNRYNAHDIQSLLELRADELAATKDEEFRMLHRVLELLRQLPSDPAAAEETQDKIPGECGLEFSFTKSRGVSPRRRDTGLAGAFAALDKRVHGMAQHHAELKNEVKSLFGAMRGGDLFVYTSLTELPLEFKEHFWAGDRDEYAALEAALRNGARFLYLGPSADAVARAQTVFEDVIPTWEDWKRGVERLKKKITGFGGEDHLVAWFPCIANLVLVPKHKFMMFRAKRGDGVKRRALIQLPVGNQSPYQAHLPLPEDFANMFLPFCKSALREVEDPKARAWEERL